MEYAFIDELTDKYYGSIAKELMFAARSGHLCIKKNEKNDACFALKGDEETFEAPVGRWNDLYYLQRNWVVEQQIVSNFKRLNTTAPYHLPLERGTLNALQFKGLFAAFNHTLSCLCGGPGTGKSFVISEIARQWTKSMCVIAPTGKAAALFRDKLDCVVGTIHQILKINDSKDLFFGGIPLDFDMVIVDECSMIDAALFAALLRNIKTGTRLVLVGDENQLPPVEIGNVFEELCQYIEETQKAYTRLEQCMRCDKKEILDMAQMVKNGYPIPFEALEYNIKDWRQRFDKGGFRLLSCVRKGPFGVENINELMWNGKKIPIILTRTSKTLQLSNGETGFLVKEQEGRRVEKEDFAIFSEKKIMASLLPDYEPAYCISVHKSQGSEDKDLCIFLPPGSEVFGKEILYTAITRAKESFSLFTTEETLEKCLKLTSKKCSGIYRKLCEY